MAKTKGSKECSRCHAEVGNRLASVEFIFPPLNDNDDAETPKPIVIDLRNQNVRLGAKCIVNGGKEELIDTIIATSGVPRTYKNAIFQWWVKEGTFDKVIESDRKKH